MIDIIIFINVWLLLILWKSFTVGIISSLASKTVELTGAVIDKTIEYTAVIF